MIRLKVWSFQDCSTLELFTLLWHNCKMLFKQNSEKNRGGILAFLTYCSKQNVANTHIHTTGCPVEWKVLLSTVGEGMCEFRDSISLSVKVSKSSSLQLPLFILTSRQKSQPRIVSMLYVKGWKEKQENHSWRNHVNGSLLKWSVYIAFQASPPPPTAIQ